MHSAIRQQHWNDANGNPSGGSTFGDGFAISWQNGPLGRDSARQEPNGAFVENIIAAAKGRLEYYQESRFRCEENAEAIEHLAAALAACNRRTTRRVADGVEGTHAGK